jgi:hypothetical protein
VNGPVEVGGRVGNIWRRPGRAESTLSDGVTDRTPVIRVVTAQLETELGTPVKDRGIKRDIRVTKTHAAELNMVSLLTFRGHKPSAGTETTRHTPSPEGDGIVTTDGQRSV